MLSTIFRARRQRAVNNAQMRFDSSKMRGENWFSILAIERSLIGRHLALVRKAHGWSFSQLEQASGVSRSEIHRVENGAQDCRLVTFLRLAWALGVPWGHMLDNLSKPMEKKISLSWKKDDPKFADLEKTLDIKGWEDIGQFAAQVSEIAIFATVLARFGNASRQAERVIYPDSETKLAFESYAAKLDINEDWKWRLDLLRRLSQLPATTLEEEGILPIRFLRDFLHRAPQIKNAYPHRKFWQPFDQLAMFPDDPFAAAAKLNTDYIDTSQGFDNLLGMIRRVPTWEELKQTVRTHTAGRGEKSALAEEIGVTRQVFSNWLADGSKGAPNAEQTLRLLKWVNDPKRKTK